jgi:hypothetical protein
LHELTLRAFAQPYGLQRLSALDVLSQPASNLRDESSLILRIPEGSGGELGGAQVRGEAARATRLFGARLEHTFREAAQLSGTLVAHAFARDVLDHMHRWLSCRACRSATRSEGDRVPVPAPTA